MNGYPTAPDDWFNKAIQRDRGIFDRMSFEIALKHVVRWGCAVDVGAHVGTWTLGMARQFSHVVAFEPDKENHFFLQNNIRDSALNNISAYNLAVGDEAGFCAVEQKVEHNSGEKYIIPGTDVKIVRLDDMLAAYPVDFLKIDVEGYELHVLRGARETIRRGQPTIILEWKGHEARYGVDRNMLDEFMAEMGYNMVRRIRDNEVFIPQ